MDRHTELSSLDRVCISCSAVESDLLVGGDKSQCTDLCWHGVPVALHEVYCTQPFSSLTAVYIDPLRQADLHLDIRCSRNSSVIDTADID